MHKVWWLSILCKSVNFLLEMFQITWKLHYSTVKKLMSGVFFDPKDHKISFALQKACWMGLPFWESLVVGEENKNVEKMFQPIKKLWVVKVWRGQKRPHSAIVRLIYLLVPFYSPGSYRYTCAGTISLIIIYRWTIYILTSCLIDRWLAIYKCLISFDLHMCLVTSLKCWSPILPSAT